MTSPSRRTRAALRRVAALVLPAGLAAGLVLGLGVTGAAAATKTVSLSGVTLNFGDQFKEYQTIFAATNALQGAAVQGQLEQLHRRAARHRGGDRRFGRPR